MQVDISKVEYAGFGVRLLAYILDSVVQLCVIVPLALAMFGSAFFTNPEFNGGAREYLLTWFFPLLYAVLFWKYKSATPGKIWMGIMIVDARTGVVPVTGKLLLRYVGYIVCVLTLMLGFLLILIDKKKRGLHDMMAGTLVIKTPELVAQEHNVSAQDETRHFMDR